MDDRIRQLRELVVARLSREPDFPALSATISAINGALASDDEPIARLCEGILRDFGLTQRLLRLVNAACYKQYGGSISTVSRAVMILGCNGVRDAALALVLLDRLGDRANAQALREELGGVYLSGVAAREIAGRLKGGPPAEEAFVCAMFHRLGRLIALFYLAEEFAQVSALRRERDLSEEDASREVLGLSFAELGLGVARKWNFPESITQSLVPVPDPREEPAIFRTQRLRAIAAMACEISDATREPDEAARTKGLARVAERFGTSSGMDSVATRAAARDAARAYQRDAVPLGLSAAPVAGMLAGAAEPGPEPAIAGIALDDSRTGAPAGLSTDRRALLAAGIQDATQALAGDHKLNDVLRIILESMYRAVGFTRVLLFVRDPNGGALRARMGFGDRAAALCAEGFAIPGVLGRDVFRAALEKGVDVCIDDVGAERIHEYIPEWLRARMPSRAFVLLPLTVGGKVLGLVHADADRHEVIEWAPGELSLLKTLRNQAVLALRQRP